MVDILFNDAEWYEQNNNIPGTESLMWNLVKNSEPVSEKKTIRDYDILYMYISQWQEQITPKGKIYIVTKCN